MELINQKMNNIYIILHLYYGNLFENPLTLKCIKPISIVFFLKLIGQLKWKLCIVFKEMDSV